MSPQRTPEERKTQRELARRMAGNDFVHALKVHWKSARFTTWDEAIAELAAGPTVTLRCSAGRGSHTKHQVRFDPDGTVDLMAHRDAVLVADSEFMMAALGGPMLPCVAVALHLPDNHLIPRHFAVESKQALNVRIRALYTAAMWARHPDTDWTPQFGDDYLRFGITPAIRDEWVSAGWDLCEALRFLQRFVPRDRAERWRAVGRTTLRDAGLAGLGEEPDEEAKWAAAGFTPARSARWRKTSFAPDVAHEWDRHKISPTMATLFARGGHHTGSLSVETIKQWCLSGVPDTDVRTWHAVSSGDLAVARDWAATGIRPHVLSVYQQWNTTRPGWTWSAAEVKAWHRAKVPVDDPALLDLLRRRRLTPRQFATLDTIPDAVYQQYAVLGYRSGVDVRFVKKTMSWPRMREPFITLADALVADAI